VFGRTGDVVKAAGDYTLTDLGDVSGKAGTTGVVQMFGGGAANDGDCAKFDSAGNLISAGEPCNAQAQLSSGAQILDNRWSDFGIATDSTRTTLASVTIPGGTLSVGDKLTIKAVFSRTGNTLGPRSSVRFGGVDLITDYASGTSDTHGYAQAEVLITGPSSQFAVCTFHRSNGVMSSPNRSAPAESIAEPIVIRFDGRFSSGSGDALTLDWYSVEVNRK
jgi:hypothetical protein